MGIVTLYTTFRLNHHSQNLSRRRKSTVGLESVARYDIIVKTFVYKSLLHKYLIQNANDHLQSKMPFKKSAKKATNEPAEAIPSTVVETGEKKKRGRKPGQKVKPKKKESYSGYIFKVLKQVHPDTGITKKSMNIMNSFVNDIFERIAAESSRLAKYNKRATITSREIQTAVRLLLPGELAKHAVSEGTKAVTKYTNSK